MLIFYVNPYGKNNYELWSIILGFDEKLTLDNNAFNLGILAISLSSYYLLSLLFLSLFLFFFPLLLLIFSYSSSNLLFILYFCPLNYLVNVADTKNILLFNLFIKNNYDSFNYLKYSRGVCSIYFGYKLTAYICFCYVIVYAFGGTEQLINWNSSIGT